jgi:hypothetical protein
VKRKRHLDSNSNKWNKTTNQKKGTSGNIGHKDMNAQAHISEILDSDNQSELSDQDSKDSSDDSHSPANDIWKNADFWGKMPPKPVMQPKLQKAAKPVELKVESKVALVEEVKEPTQITKPE